MRPIPRVKHPIALVALVVVAAFYGGLALRDPILDDSQITLATAAVSAADGELFPADPLYGAQGPVLPPSPAFVGVLRLTLPLADGNPVRLLRLTVGPLVLVYLLGMYTLLLRQCRSWSIAAFVAVLSTAVIKVMGDATWGLGTLSSIGPTGLPMATTPWIVLGLLSALDRRLPGWRLVAVFLAAGLLGHFDLSWMLNLTLVLAGTYLVRRRFAPAAWAVAAGCLVLAAAAALPPLVQCLRARMSDIGGPEQVQAFGALLREGEHALLYPQALRAIPDWLAWAVPLAIPAAVTLSQVDRFRTPYWRFWAAFAACTAVVAVVAQLLSQGVAAAAGIVPPVTGFVRATCLLMLPLYALFAQALTSLFRLTAGHHGLMRVACALAAVAWLLPSDNFAPARHALYDGVAVLLREEYHPSRLRRLEESATRRGELAAIARWSRANTATDAVFITDESLFRLWSRRAIVAGNADGSYLRCCEPACLLAWRRRLLRQSSLLRPTAVLTDPAAIGKFVGDLSANPPFSLGGAWYVLLPAAAAPEGSAVLTEIPAADWGRFYQLYRVK